jgi:hypothetical protein
MTITCHVSPDCGWEELEKFLGLVKRRLAVGLHQFSATHIVQRLVGVMRQSRRKLLVVLDPWATPVDEGDPRGPQDLTSDQVRQRLESALQRRLDFAPTATERSVAPGAASRAAYHVNAAVRDSTALWLSCGDWRSVNQPNKKMLAHLSSQPMRASRPYPRVWHIEVAHGGLAKTFELLLQHDFNVVRNSGAPVTPPLQEPRPDLFVSVKELEPRSSASRGQTPFSRHVSRLSASRGRVQPLLSPDDYFEHVLPLIQSASESLRFQNPYIHLSPAPHPKFAELVRALRDKMNAPNLNARLILGDTPSTRDMLEALESIGFRMNQIKVQRGVRTQGIIIDAKAVVIGSHRWSSAGLLRDRAASLLIRDAGVAGYLQRVFDHDWQRLAGKTVSAERAMPELAVPVGPAPDGMVRVPWGAVFDV